MSDPLSQEHDLLKQIPELVGLSPLKRGKTLQTPLV
jgi:hypothetical protein